MKRDRAVLTDDLRRRVDKRCRELLDKAATLWPDHRAAFQDAPVVRFDVRNRYGGYALTNEWTVRLNPVLCYENEEHFIKQTVGHEIAHLVNRVVNGFTKRVLVRKGVDIEWKIKKVMVHGPEWRQVMVAFGLTPYVTHSYNTSSIEIKARKRSSRALTPEKIAKYHKLMQSVFKRLPPKERQAFLDWGSGYEDPT